METDRTEPPASELNRPFITQQRSEQLTRPVSPQATVAALVCLTAACVGLTEGYLHTLPFRLHTRSSDFEAFEEAVSWFDSIYKVASPVGFMLSGIMMELCGRRLTVQIAVASLCIGCFHIFGSTTYPNSLVVLAVCRFGIGVSIPGLFFYLQEITDSRLRGSLSACIPMTLYIGFVLNYEIGFNISWIISAILAGGFALIGVVGYSFLHETPVWYVRNNRISDARKVFSWLWGSVHDVQAERDLEELLKRLEGEKRAVSNEMGSSGTYWGKWKQYLKPHVYKPFIIIHVFSLMQILCGTDLVEFCVVDIIADGKSDDSLEIKFVQNLILFVKSLFLIVSSVILLWFGRRIICVSSGVSSGIAAILIGTFVYMQTIHTWIIIGLVLLYVAFNTYGYFVMAQTMIGEILPSNVRCVGGAYIFTMHYIAIFFATKYFSSAVTAVGTHGLLWIFGVSSLLCSLFLYLMLPETKGRSLVQIEEYFLQPNVLWLTRKKSQNIRNTNI